MQYLTDMTVTSLATTDGLDDDGNNMPLLEIGVSGHFPNGDRALSVGRMYPGVLGKDTIVQFFTYYGMAFNHVDLACHLDGVD